ncbi:MAG: CPBP family intramembrane metalloprotease [Saprospiraceae bacterium]|nr:CPBP family intramembrane metalloprotease [Saprospiraceae bacterium]
MNQIVDQIPFNKQVFNHFYVGIVITIFYVWISPLVINAGMPGFSVLLIAEIGILLPLVVAHLWRSSKKYDTGINSIELIPYRKKISPKKFLLWTLAGLLGCIVIYIPLFPIGLYLRESIFGWLPEWYFNPTYGTENIDLIAKVFLAGILIDGFIGPVAEEIFFRGYLLPRMAYLKKWAPIVNGVMFGLYHFWQPHNLIALIAIGILLSYVVWKTKNVYLGIAIHCTLNILGGLGGYMAVMSGTMIGR